MKKIISKEEKKFKKKKKLWTGFSHSAMTPLVDPLIDLLSGDEREIRKTNILLILGINPKKTKTMTDSGPVIVPSNRGTC